MATSVERFTREVRELLENRSALVDTVELIDEGELGVELVGGEQMIVKVEQA